MYDVLYCSNLIRTLLNLQYAMRKLCDGRHKLILYNFVSVLSSSSSSDLPWNCNTRTLISIGDGADALQNKKQAAFINNFLVAACEA
jgi:hypothetical protein